MDAEPREPMDAATAHNRATYDRIATRYAENARSFPMRAGYYVEDMRRGVVDAIGRRGLLADLGCGPGADAGWFAEQGLTVLGVDLSAGMLVLASGVLGPRVAQGDLRALPLTSGTLDAVWCAAALLHVPDRDTARVLAEIRRVLRPGGVLGLVTALGESERFEAVPYAEDERRWFVYRDPEDVRTRLGAAGFVVRESGVAEGNRRWGWFLAVAGAIPA